MKKIFILFAMMFAFMFTSCKDSVGGFLYNVNVDGSAKGDVVVTFPNGNLELNGDAGLAFKYSNDTTLVKSGVKDEVLLGAALDSDKEETRTFATSVNNGFSVALKDASAEGSFHVHIHGYAKEPKTGLVIYIDRTYDYPEPVNEVVE